MARRAAALRKSDKSAAEVRAALEMSNPNVLRVALYHSTRDPELAAMEVVKASFWGGAFDVPALGERDSATVREKACAFLLDGPVNGGPAPSEEELRFMMDMLYGKPVGNFRYQLGRGDLVEDRFPLGVKWSREPIGTAKQAFRVVVIGAGLAGLAAAIQLEQLGIPYTVIERNAGPGGVWWVNNYPGLRVDVASHHYQYSFMKNFRWKHFFATRDELKNYAEEVVERHHLRSKIRFSTTLLAAHWDEESSTWRLKLRSAVGVESLVCNALISAAGLFNAIKTPAIPGLSDFRAKVFHSTQWDHSHSYAGKRVGQIGVGATGAQLMPELAKTAAKVTVFQRTPHWIAPVDGYQAPIPDGVQWLFDNVPHYWGWYSFFSFLVFSAVPQDLITYDPEWQAKGGLISERNDLVRSFQTSYIQSKLGHNPELMRKATPTFPPWSQRPILDNGWFDALNKSNVELVTDPIERITSDAVRTKDGSEHKLDLLVLCSGFEVDRYLWPVEYVGRGGISLEKVWAKDGARAYLGVTVPDFPNLFIVYGPNSQNVAGGGLIKWLEVWSRYAVKTIVHMMEANISAMSIKRSVYDHYNARMDEELQKCIWTAPGQQSYYINQHGRAGTNNPWASAEYFEWLVAPNFDDFEVRET
jgi:4-hydroxyacetophenone monooxygenase